MIDNERFPTERVHVIPNGVDTDRFQPNPTAAARLRHELSIPADAPVAGIVAALRPEKNHALFLQTAALVRGKVPGAHFVIVGDGPERSCVETNVAELGLGDCVHLVGSRSDIPAVLSMLDAFLLTSHNEANPVSILEAMSVGLPVVSTNVGSIAESVDHGATGYLSPPGSGPDLADSLITLFTEPQLAARFGAAGRQRVVTNWSLEAMVGGYEELLWSTYRRKRGPVVIPDPPAAAKVDTELARVAQASRL